MVFRLLQRDDCDRPQDDRAPLDLDLEQGLVVQTEGSPDVCRQGHPPGWVHGNDASHAALSIPDVVTLGQIDCLTSRQIGNYAGGAMRRSLRFNGVYEDTAMVGRARCADLMTAASAHQLPTPVRGQARSVFV